MILITGATGCLGSNLTRALVCKGESVAIFRRPSDDLTALADIVDKVEHRLGDVRDFESVLRALVGVKQVYHLAGVTAPLNVLHETMMEVNVNGTKNMAHAALKAGVQRMVYTSSVAAVGFPDQGLIATEDFVFNGREFGHSYMITKWLAERVILDFVARGLDAVIVNPSAVMAPGGDFRASWASLVIMIKAGKLLGYPGGGFGMTTRKDMVEAHIKAMEKGVTGQRYIVNSVNLTYRELCNIVAQVVGGRSPLFRFPNWLLQFGSQINRLYASQISDPTKIPLLLPENVFMLTRFSYYSQSKALRELGISQSPIEDAIYEVYCWCKANGACL